MSRLGRKLVLWMSLILIGFGMISLGIVNLFAERYYLKNKKQEQTRVYRQLVEQDPKEKAVFIKTLEQQGIVITETGWDSNLERLNETIKENLKYKGISVKKLWLWEEDYEKLKEGSEVNKLYNQGPLNYSVLMKFKKEPTGLVTLTSVIPHTTEIVKLLSGLNVLTWSVSLVFIVGVMRISIKKVTEPLVQLQAVAGHIAQLEFEKVEIKTGDEIEALAESINEMSESLKTSHSALERKNEEMKQLLAGVSHELKTPLAVIKAYGQGIKDGLDDGTFLDTMMEQNESMTKKVHQLLQAAREEVQDEEETKVDLKTLIEKMISVQRPHLEQNDIIVQMHLTSCNIKMNQSDMEVILNNFITNAIKYTYNQLIELTLESSEHTVQFKISNGVSPNLKNNLGHLWEPFYVAEASRSKALCGTGLGLYTTKNLLEKHHIAYGVELKEEKIEFWFQIKCT